jgi:ATP-binding cassette subfamily F protein 3
VRENLGGIYEFLRYKKMQSLNVLEIKAKATAENKKEEAQNVSENKLSYEARKELSKKIKKAERSVEEAETKISAFESEIKALEDKMATGISDGEILNVYNKKKRESEQLLYEWEILTEELEELKNQG